MRTLLFIVSPCDEEDEDLLFASVGSNKKKVCLVTNVKIQVLSFFFFFFFFLVVVLVPVSHERTVWFGPIGRGLVCSLIVGFSVDCWL